LWATVALLAAGKNPADEWVKGGVTADDYLAAHHSKYVSLSDLGLLALVQSAAGTRPVRYGDPTARLEGLLNASSARRDPHGTALAVLGLLAANTPDAPRTASAQAHALLS